MQDKVSLLTSAVKVTAEAVKVKVKVKVTAEAVKESKVATRAVASNKAVVAVRVPAVSPGSSGSLGRV